MFEIKVISEFAASHRLREYGGKCERVHGHNWKVEVICESEVLDKIGLVLDFRILKEKLHSVIDELDHTDLNEIEHFKKNNPSSEQIAKYIFVNLCKDKELCNKARLKRVNIWETENSCASYFE